MPSKIWLFGKIVLIHYLWKCKLAPSLWKTIWHHHQKPNTHFAMWPKISFPEKSKPQQYRVHMIIADVSVKAPNEKQTKCLATEE